MLIRSVLLASSFGALMAWMLSAPAHDSATPDAITADGGRYYGPLLDGTLHGKGRLEWEGGERYVGEFVRGQFSGRGVRSDASGRRYEGKFARGMFEGQGRHESPDGDVHEGQFVRNQFTGHGRYRNKDGAFYEGQFVNWRFHGMGRYRNTAGFVYQGLFANGHLQGQGSITGPDGGRYDGDLRNWAPHGHGVFRLANGDVYTGAFDDGVYHGRGTLRYAKPQDDGRLQDEGTWRDGELENPRQASLAQRNIESALYRQRELLDRAVTALQAPAPNAINLYMLSVAGDGTQEVFRREVDFVDRQFATRFGAAGRTLTLINSRHTGAIHPMATRTSIEQSLLALADRMDKSRDILFLFLTSHGSKDHQLSLEQSGMNLRDLPATELARMVRATGIRWKVVVVSACYSGGFIDPLKDDNTLVITAARHDRRSFGCSDDNDFTYFGRAFFKEALPMSTSFQDAFRRAEKRVSQWERKDIEGRGAAPEAEYSFPQMHSPAPMEAHLRQWWAQRQPDMHAASAAALRSAVAAASTNH